MKKKWFYLAASVILAGCAEDAFDNGLLQDNEIPQEIKLSVGTARAEVTTRGAGSIGDTINNSWKNQELSIYSFNKKTTDFTAFNNSNVYLNDIKAIATSDKETATLVWKDNTPRYYPLQGAFYFAGYYVDDATVTDNSTSNNVIKNITIDGTQDIMIAQAELTADNKKALVKSLQEYKKLTDNTSEVTNFLSSDGKFVAGIDSTDSVKIVAEYEKAFSSYTARRKVQPNMVFNHQLSRLKFSVVAGDKNSLAADSVEFGDSIKVKYAPGVLVQSITLKNVQNQGIITIGKPASNDTIITFKSNTSNPKNGFFVLKQKNDSGTLEALVPKAPKSDTNYTSIGESILAFPETQYTVDIATIQYLQKKDNNTWQLVNGKDGKVQIYEDVTIELPKIDNNPQVFKAGYTYDIKVKVYSNQEISITATLEGWKPGGDIVISPEDDIFDQDHNSSNN